MKKVSVNNLQISEELLKFVNDEAIPGTDLDINKFWKGFDDAVHNLTPINKKLLKKRDDIQKKIDEWHLQKKGSNFNKDEYFNFLKSIGYIAEDQGDFEIETANVDKEISSIAGPQLVVPVDNARYALNAANARWGSLYDAVYGTDVIPGEIGKVYSEERGKKVINYVREFLDEIFPINEGSWKEVTKITISGSELKFLIKDKNESLKNKKHFVGFVGEKQNPTSVLLKNNNLHIDIIIDPNSSAGKSDKANISNVIVESAISTIVDNEDSVAAVDSKDKVKCYRNWLGLMKGNLEAEVKKNGKKFVIKLSSDRIYTGPDGSKVVLHGRALLLNRNVGHLMTNPSITLKDGSEFQRV